MKAIPYRAKSGEKQFMPECTQGEVLAGNLGFCLACGAEASGVELDARRCKCEICGKPKVYGLAELLFMQLIEITD